MTTLHSIHHNTVYYFIPLVCACMHACVCNKTTLHSIHHNTVYFFIPLVCACMHACVCVRACLKRESPWEICNLHDKPIVGKLYLSLASNDCIKILTLLVCMWCMFATFKALQFPQAEQLNIKRALHDTIEQKGLERICLYSRIKVVSHLMSLSQKRHVILPNSTLKCSMHVYNTAFTPFNGPRSARQAVMNLQTKFVNKRNPAFGSGKRTSLILEHLALGLTYITTCNYQTCRDTMENQHTSVLHSGNWANRAIEANVRTIPKTMTPVLSRKNSSV